MNPEIITALISVFGGIAVGAVGYIFTKMREREAEWRRDKLEYYKTSIRTLNGVLEGETSPEGKRIFSQSCNDLLLFAPQAVLSAMFDYLDETRDSNEKKSLNRHDELLSKFILEIRKDLKLRPKDNINTFQVRLRSPGK